MCAIKRGEISLENNTHIKIISANQQNRDTKCKSNFNKQVVRIFKIK